MSKLRGTILAVDDNPSNTILLEHILSEEYDIITFTEPQKVVGHLNHSKVHLILSDLVMPEMNGIELLKTIKKKHPGLPFIILSAYDRDQDIKAAYEEGAYKYIVKPINIPDLFEHIKKALGEG